MDIDELENAAREMAFASPENKKNIRDAIGRDADEQGIFVGTIRPVYERMADGTYTGFTVPAINVRGLVFDIARAAFEVARASESGPFMFEIAPAELTAGAQTYEEYAGEILLAALAEKWEGPVFLQGDHFQVEGDEPASLSRLERECAQALGAGFLQIDIDASDLRDDLAGSGELGQTGGAELTARAVQLVRRLPFPGRQVLLGGEVGRIGGALTSEHDLRAFLDRLSSLLGSSEAGIGKVSVNTGTRHGGVVDEQGRVGDMPVDFALIRRLSEIARREYGLPGIVQHGASTMSFDQMAKLPSCGVNEVHLATALQTLVFEHPAFPQTLLHRMERELAVKRGERSGPEPRTPRTGVVSPVIREEGWLAWGQYKSELWDLSPQVRAELRRGAATWFRSVFGALALGGKGAITRAVSDESRIRGMQ